MNLSKHIWKSLLLSASLTFYAFSSDSTVVDSAVVDSAGVDSSAVQSADSALIQNLQTMQFERDSLAQKLQQQDSLIQSLQATSKQNAELSSARNDSLRRLETFAMKLKQQSSTAGGEADSLRQQVESKDDQVSSWKKRVLVPISASLIFFGLGFGIGSKNIP